MWPGTSATLNSHPEPPRDRRIPAGELNRAEIKPLSPVQTKRGLCRRGKLKELGRAVTGLPEGARWPSQPFSNVFFELGITVLSYLSVLLTPLAPSTGSFPLAAPPLVNFMNK